MQHGNERALSRGARGDSPRKSRLSRGARGDSPRKSKLSRGAREASSRMQEASAGEPDGQALRSRVSSAWAPAAHVVACKEAHSTERRAGARTGRAAAATALGVTRGEPIRSRLVHSSLRRLKMAFRFMACASLRPCRKCLAGAKKSSPAESGTRNMGARTQKSTPSRRAGEWPSIALGALASAASSSHAGRQMARIRRQPVRAAGANRCAERRANRSGLGLGIARQCEGERKSGANPWKQHIALVAGGGNDAKLIVLALP